MPKDRRSVARAAKRVSAVALLAAMAALCSDRIAFKAPAVLADELTARIARDLNADGMLVAMDMDGAYPRDAASGRRLHCVGTESVGGGARDARRFVRGRTGVIHPQSSWSDIDVSRGYTVFARVRIPRGSSRDQDICVAGSDAAAGLLLADGRFVFRVPGARPEREVDAGGGDSTLATDAGTVALSAPCAMDGRFASVACVVDAAAGEARLYLNGAIADSAAVAPSRMPRERICVTTETWHPFAGDIDEMDVWNRALSPAEIAAASRPRFSAARHCAPVKSWLLDCAVALRRAPATLVRVFDRFKPRISGMRRMAAFPLVELSMDSADRRHFANADDASDRNGERSKSAANFRKCRIVIGTSMADVRIALDDVYSQGPGDSSRRMAYIVDGDIDGDGARETFRLYPPEDHARLHPCSVLPLPLDESAFVRLAVSGDQRGVYCIEPFARNGRGRMADIGNRRSPLAMIPNDCAFERIDAEKRRAVFLEALAPVLADWRSEWSEREWNRVFDDRTELMFDGWEISEFEALGGNDAPFHLTGDLDLSGEAFDKVERWIASNPQVLDENGHVRRPQGEVPVRADLTPVVDGHARHPLRFRVMPESPRLPVVMLYIGAPVSRDARVDFIADVYPADGGAPTADTEVRPPDSEPWRLSRDTGGRGSVRAARRLYGTGDHGGGIRHRGNTSYWKGEKKSFSLEFDGPHGLVGPADARHVYLVSGYSDDTRMRNRLSFDLFRSFAGERAERFAPEIAWAEVFVNGAYYGVFEMSSRVNAEMFANGECAELFKVKKFTPLYRERSSRAFVQVMPNPRDDCRESTLLHLMGITTAGTRAAFIEGAKEIDTLCFIDFMLLANLTGNADGIASNHYVARGADGRFFFIPWDYDKTFRADSNKTWMGNHLDARFREALPGYRGAMAARWRELRAGPLADAAVDALIDGYAEELDGYLGFEYELIGREVEGGQDGAVTELRKQVQARLHMLDGQFK